MASRRMVDPAIWQSEDLTNAAFCDTMSMLRSDRCGAFAFSATAQKIEYLKGNAPRTCGLASRYQVSATGGNMCGALWV